MKARKELFIGKWIFFVLLALAAFIFLVMVLWNWLIPVLFKGPVLNYWQTLGLLALSKILFSGIGKHHRDNNDHKKWRKWFYKKMNGISKENKEELKNKLEGSEL